MNAAPIEHRAAKVSLVTGLSTVFAVGIQLISVPVCLHYWGRDNYGSWLALYSAFMLLRSLDGGYVIFVGNKLNYLYHQDALALRRHLSSAVYGILIISALQLVLALAAATWNPISVLLGVSTGARPDRAAGLGLVVLMVSWVLTGSYLGIVHRLLIPAGLMYQAAWWAMAFQLCQFAAIIGAALLGLSMLETSALFALSQVLIYVLSALYVRRALPQFSPWLGAAELPLGLRDFARSLFLTSSNLIQQGTLNGTVLMVSALGGPVAVPVFTTVRTLTNLWTSVTTVLSTPLLPDVVRLHAKNEAQKLLTINQAYWVLVGSVVNVGALLSYPLMPFIYGEWTAHTVPLDEPLLCLLLASVVVANSGALMALHLNGINSLRIVLGASIARAVFGLGGGWLAYRWYGLAGFGLGVLAGEIVATGATVRHFVKYEIAARGLKMPGAAFWPAVLGTGSALVFLVGAAFGGWSLGWAWGLAMIGTLGGAVMGWRSMDRELRLRMKGLLSFAIRRQGPPVASER